MNNQPAMATAATGRRTDVSSVDKRERVNNHCTDGKQRQDDDRETNQPTIPLYMDVIMETFMHFINERTILSDEVMVMETFLHIQWMNEPFHSIKMW